MARVKDMLEVQKAIIHALLKPVKTKNETTVKVGCSQRAISKITKQTCSKWSICSSKPKLEMNVKIVSLSSIDLLIVVKFPKFRMILVSLLLAP